MDHVVLMMWSLLMNSDCPRVDKSSEWMDIFFGLEVTKLLEIDNVSKHLGQPALHQYLLM